MQDDQIFNSVKRACYAGLDSVTLRRTVSDRLSRAIPFDGYAFGTTDPDTNLLSHIVVEGLPSRMAEQFIRELYPWELVHLHNRMARAGHFVFSAMDLTPEMHRHVQDSGFGYEVHVVLAAGGHMWGKFCLMHQGGPTSADARARTMLRRLAPHMSRGLRAAALLEHGLAPDAAFDAGTPGVLVLDEHDRPTIRTDAAMLLLDDVADVGLALPAGIPISVRLLAAQLRSLHERASDSVEVPNEVTIHTRGRSGRWYAIRATLAEPDQSGDCSTVIIIQPLGAHEIAPLLTRMYGLSAREREIAGAVARGESTKEIAHRLEISPYTVAEHIGRACDKVGVRGRKALVAQLFLQGYVPGLCAENPVRPGALASSVA
jgi:DNA-binding CsgD family transcriptional regulator